MPKPNPDVAEGAVAAAPNPEDGKGLLAVKLVLTGLSSGIVARAGLVAEPKVEPNAGVEVANDDLLLSWAAGAAPNWNVDAAGAVLAGSAGAAAVPNEPNVAAGAAPPPNPNPVEAAGAVAGVVDPNGKASEAFGPVGTFGSSSQEMNDFRLAGFSSSAAVAADDDSEKAPKDTLFFCAPKEPKELTEELSAVATFAVSAAIGAESTDFPKLNPSNAGFGARLTAAGGTFMTGAGAAEPNEKLGVTLDATVAG